MTLERGGNGVLVGVGLPGPQAVVASCFERLVGGFAGVAEACDGDDGGSADADQHADKSTGGGDPGALDCWVHGRRLAALARACYRHEAGPRARLGSRAPAMT